MSFFLFSAWHSSYILVLNNCELSNPYHPLSLEIDCKNDLAGLKAGMLCSGMINVVFFEIVRAVFSALCVK